jgi:hypothetical protein
MESTIIIGVKKLDNFPSGETQTLYWDGKRFVTFYEQAKRYKTWGGAQRFAMTLDKEKYGLIFISANVAREPITCLGNEIDEEILTY